MNKHIIASVALALPGLFFSSLAASAQGLDINLSSDALRGQFAFDVGVLPRNNAQVAIGGLFSEDLDPEDTTALHVGLLVTGDTGARAYLRRSSRSCARSASSDSAKEPRLAADEGSCGAGCRGGVARKMALGETKYVSSSPSSP